MNELIDFTPEDADTQCKEIMLYLEQHPEGITLYEAFLTLGCSKLSTRVEQPLPDIAVLEVCLVISLLSTTEITQERLPIVQTMQH